MHYEPKIWQSGNQLCKNHIILIDPKIFTYPFGHAGGKVMSSLSLISSIFGHFGVQNNPECHTLVAWSQKVTPRDILELHKPHIA